MEQKINAVVAGEGAQRSLLTISQVLKRCGVGKTYVYKAIRLGKFPAPIKLSPKFVRWDSRAIDEWIDQVASK